MQPTSFTRSALEAGSHAPGPARDDQAVIAAQPVAAEKAVAGAARQAGEPMPDFADELVQFADDRVEFADDPRPVLQPDTKAPAELPATEANAEQWLLHMLEQQSAQLQARDAEHGSTHETHEVVNAPTQALPRELPAQGLPERAVNDPPFNASPATLKAPAETLKTSTGLLKAPAGLLKASGDTLEVPDGALKTPARALKASAEELAARTVSTVVSGAVSAQPEKLKLDPAWLEGESVHQPLNTQAERLAASATVSEVATRMDAALMNTPVTESAALERTLKLQGPETKWGEQLLLALRDNVKLQMQQRVQNTTIRLDPPELGMMEITLTHEQGRLNVQISAQHSDVVRLLQQTSDRLRHELVAQNFTQVDVEISGGQPGQQHSQRDQARALTEPSVLANQHEADQSDAHHLAPEQQKSAQHNDVLITV